MQTNEGKQDVIIIGGGLAGLAAAALLARQGKSVRLFEQAHTVGGRARTGQKDGYYFNIGPHALYRGGRGIKVLRELGITPQGAPPSASGAYAIKDGAKHTFPAGPFSLMTTGLFNLSEKLETARLLGSLGKLDADKWMGTTLREWVDTHITQPGVRGLLHTVFRLATYANAPELMSAGAALKQLQLAFADNVLYLDGGWQTLVDGLRCEAERAGVAIETGAKVEAVERNIPGAVEGVRLADGRSYQASTVVIAASPEVAAALVEGGRQTALGGWAAEAIPVKAACLSIALSRLPKPKATVAFGVDRPLYLSVHSAVARLAPEGGATIYTAMYLPPGHDRSPENDERELEGLLNLVQPGWREVVAHRQFLPAMTVANALPTAQREGTKGRPGPQVPDVPGLYVVGDWVGQEGLLADASLASAKQAAEIIAASTGESQKKNYVAIG